MFETYEEAVQWITNLVPLGMKPGLKRMEALMEQLGSPERRLKFIHVGGTNGKGSTCSMLASVLRTAGYDVGMFTSPYIESFTSRIVYNGEPIPEQTVLELTNKLYPITQQIAETELGSPTMFEVATALAILYYAEVVYPDYVVFEVGMGGRLDSTNIVYPVISVITNIGMDHTNVLGDTISQIAAEKAGIIKPGVPVISGVEHPDAALVIQATAAENKSTLYQMGKQFHYQSIKSQQDEQLFDFEGLFRKIPGLEITLNGAHQLKNAAVAVMTLEVLAQYQALIVEDDALTEGLKHAKWPGRLEMLSTAPRLLADGAHNPEGAKALSEALTNIYTYDRLHLMFGMIDTKEHEKYLAHILPLVDTLIITEPNFRKRMDAHRLAEIAEQMREERSIKIIVEPDWKKALEQLKQAVQEKDLGVVTGTLYLISDVRSWVLHQTESEKGW